MSKKIFENECEIESNEKWFSFFVIVPKICAIILAVAGGVTGFVFLLLDSDWLWLCFVCWAGGAVLAIGTYAVLKLSLAYKILHISYLKKIADGGVVSSTKKANLEAELPEI